MSIPLPASTYPLCSTHSWFTHCFHSNGSSSEDAALFHIYTAPRRSSVLKCHAENRTLHIFLFGIYHINNYIGTIIRWIKKDRNWLGYYGELFKKPQLPKHLIAKQISHNITKAKHKGMFGSRVPSIHKENLLFLRQDRIYCALGQVKRMKSNVVVGTNGFSTMGPKPFKLHFRWIAVSGCHANSI